MHSKHTLSLVIIGLLTVGFAVAVDPSGANITNSSNLGGLPTVSPGTVSIIAGNVTQANIETNASTYRWAGLIGNVSGNIQLGDSGSNVLYTWGAAGLLVYASTGTVTWANLQDANETNVTGNFDFLSSANSDNYSITFGGAEENIGSNLFTLTSDFATTLSAGSTTWKTYSLHDGTNTVFAGLVQEDGTSYRNTTVDYQMILPENGTGGNVASTAWNIYIELQ